MVTCTLVLLHDEDKRIMAAYSGVELRRRGESYHQGSVSVQHDPRDTKYFPSEGKVKSDCSGGKQNNLFAAKSWDYEIILTYTLLGIKYFVPLISC